MYPLRVKSMSTVRGAKKTDVKLVIMTNVEEEVGLGFVGFWRE